MTTLCVLGYAGLAIGYSEPFGRATIVLGGLIAGSMMSWNNDSHGHLAGDGLLVWTAARIRDTLLPTDVLARIGHCATPSAIAARASLTSAVPPSRPLHRARPSSR